MSFRKYCRGVRQHELPDESILPKTNKLKNFSVKKCTEIDTINCSSMRKPFIEYSRP